MKFLHSLSDHDTKMRWRWKLCFFQDLVSPSLNLGWKSDLQRPMMGQALRENSGWKMTPCFHILKMLPISTYHSRTVKPLIH